LNMNLTKSKRELLQWCHRLGYIHFCRIQLVMYLGVLATSIAQYKLQILAARLQAP
jgi:hypothetical protein